MCTSLISRETNAKMLLVGSGVYQKVFQKIFVTLNVAVPFAVKWIDVSLGKPIPPRFDAKTVLHVVMIPGSSETPGEISRVHDMIWCRNWVVAASCTIIVPTDTLKLDLLQLDVFGNMKPRITFQQLVDEEHHAIMTQFAPLSQIMTWFSHAGCMTQDSWSKVKQRCSMLERLCVLLTNQKKIATVEKIIRSDIQAIKAIAGQIDWHILGGSDAHAFAHRIEKELLVADVPSPAILLDLRARITYL